MQDLRTYLAELQEQLPGDVVHVEREVEPYEEVTAVLWKMERRGLYPVVVFDKVKNLRQEPSGMGVISNLFASREKVAVALGLSPNQAKMELSLEYARRRSEVIKPVVVSRTEAPVKQNVRRGAEANLYDLPVITHHEMDAGPYLTMPVVATDPDTGVHNASFQRMWVKSPQETGISLAPRHLWDYFQRYEARNEPMPIAVVLGHHPLVSLGSMASIPIEADEYDTMGALMGEPLRLVPSETWGDKLLVPADAEVIVEAEVLPGIREVEGPFGEFTGYYGGQKINPITRVKAITWRNQALFQTIFIGHRDSDILEGVPIEGDVYAAVKPVVPTVKAVHVPPSGKVYNCYISIDKRFEGAGKLAAVAAIPTHDFIKHVIVVDSDIDVYNEEEVLFAFATRVQGDKDIETIKGIRGNILDPSMEHAVCWTNTIIDATKPIDRAFEERLRIAPEVLERINLEDYVDSSVLQR